MSMNLFNRAKDVASANLPDMLPSIIDQVREACRTEGTISTSKFSSIVEPIKTLIGNKKFYAFIDKYDDGIPYGTSVAMGLPKFGKDKNEPKIPEKDAIEFLESTLKSD